MSAKPGARAPRSDREHDPIPRRRRDRTSRHRTCRRADGPGRRRLRALGQSSALRPEGSELGPARSLRAVERPRVDAPVRAAPSLRFRPHGRGPGEVPAARLAHAGPSRVRRDRRRRADDGPPRPGLRPRRRHGPRGAHDALAVRRRRGRRFGGIRIADGRVTRGGSRSARSTFRLRVRRRRGSDGRCGLGGRFLRRHPRPRQSHLPLRRQLDHDRRRDPDHLPRERARALPRLRLARHRRGRRPGSQRPRAGARDRSPRDRSSDTDRPEDPDRTRRPEFRGQEQGPRRSPRRRRDEARQGAGRLADGDRPRRARRRARLLLQARRRQTRRARGERCASRRLAEGESGLVGALRCRTHSEISPPISRRSCSRA